jgi:DNA-binding MarR family transcriptional regulator
LTQLDSVTPLQVALQFHRAYAVATQRLNAALQPLELSYRHAAAMFLIRDGARTHGELVRLLHVDKTSMVRTIDDLERRDIIARTRSMDDRRSWLLSLTPVGAATLRRAQQRTRAVAEELFGGLDATALASLHAALLRVPGAEAVP